MNLPDPIVDALLRHQVEAADNGGRPPYALFGLVAAVRRAGEPVGLRRICSMTGLTRQGALNAIKVGTAIGVLVEQAVGAWPKYTVPEVVNSVDQSDNQHFATQPSTGHATQPSTELTTDDSGQVSRPLSDSESPVDTRAPSGDSSRKPKKTLPKTHTSDGSASPSAPHAKATGTAKERAYSEFVEHCKAQPADWRLLMRAVIAALGYGKRLPTLPVKGGSNPVNRYQELLDCANWLAAEGETPERVAEWNRRRWGDPWYGREGNRVKATPETVMEEWERWMYAGSDEDFNEDGTRKAKAKEQCDDLSERDKRSRRKLEELAVDLGLGRQLGEGAGDGADADYREGVPGDGPGVALEGRAAADRVDMGRDSDMRSYGEAPRVVHLRDAGARGVRAPRSA